jgi:hypothetical protein
MGLYYKNLDEATRKYMLLEFEKGEFYKSERLNENKFEEWKKILHEGLEFHDDDWIAHQLQLKGLLKTHELRRKPNGGMTEVKVPSNAAQMLAEGEFNKFYLRGICSRAIESHYTHVRIYRGKEVASPRIESERKIGTTLEVVALLEELRKDTLIDSVLGLPAGPNSGLTAEIVFE